jgi:hypothetical protein
MTMTPEFRKKFLEKSDDSGRHLVYSYRTGKTYAVEPMGNPYVKWGDLNPATGKVEGKYGSKHRGSIDEKDSLITEENGFKNIEIHEPGISPASVIERLDAQYPDKE